MTRKEAYALGNIIHKEVITFYESQFDGIFKKCNTYPQYRSFRGNISIRSKLIDQIFNDHEAQLKDKDEEIAKYQMAIDKQSKRAEALKQLSLDKDNEIATAKMRHKLEHDRYLITEAIIKEKDEEIEMLQCRLYHAEGYIKDIHEPLKSITINQMGGGKDEY